MVNRRILAAILDLKQCPARTCYYPVTAQDIARARRRRLAKLARHEELLAHVMDRLRAGWSPQQIAGRLRQEAEADGEESERLCHETIYRHVYGPEGRAEQLYLCLPRARHRCGTRHGRRPRGHRIPLERGIACRPADVATRESFGHWEGDLLVFARSGGNANVTTLVERRSRFLVLLPNPDGARRAWLSASKQPLAAWPRTCAGP